MNLPNLIRTTPVGNYLPRNTRACLGSTCRNMRQFQISTNKNPFGKTANPTNAESLEKALVVRALLKEFVQDEDLMNVFASKATMFFYYSARQGATSGWAANFLNVNENDVWKFENIGEMTMKNILTKKINKIDGMLLTMIKKLRGRNNNSQNNTGKNILNELLEDTPVRFSHQTFKLLSCCRIQQKYSFFTFVTDPAKMTHVSAYVSTVNIHKTTSNTKSSNKKSNKKKSNKKKSSDNKSNKKTRNGLFNIVPLNKLQERQNWLRVTL